MCGWAGEVGEEDVYRWGKEVKGTVRLVPDVGAKITSLAVVEGTVEADAVVEVDSAEGSARPSPFASASASAPSSRIDLPSFSDPSCLWPWRLPAKKSSKSSKFRGPLGSWIIFVLALTAFKGMTGLHLGSESGVAVGVGTGDDDDGWGFGGR